MALLAIRFRGSPPCRSRLVHPRRAQLAAAWCGGLGRSFRFRSVVGCSHDRCPVRSNRRPSGSEIVDGERTVAAAASNSRGHQRWSRTGCAGGGQTVRPIARARDTWRRAEPGVGALGDGGASAAALPRAGGRVGGGVRHRSPWVRRRASLDRRCCSGPARSNAAGLVVGTRRVGLGRLVGLGSGREHCAGAAGGAVCLVARAQRRRRTAVATHRRSGGTGRDRSHPFGYSGVGPCVLERRGRGIGVRTGCADPCRLDLVPPSPYGLRRVSPATAASEGDRDTRRGLCGVGLGSDRLRRSQFALARDPGTRRGHRGQTARSVARPGWCAAGTGCRGVRLPTSPGVVVLAGTCRSAGAGARGRRLARRHGDVSDRPDRRSRGGGRSRGGCLGGDGRPLPKRSGTTRRRGDGRRHAADGVDHRVSGSRPFTDPTRPVRRSGR